MPASLRSKRKTADLVLRIIAARCQGLSLGSRWEGTCTMTVYGHWRHKNGKRKRRDVHNYCVVLIDLLETPLGFDDSQICSFVMNKRDAKDREHVVVTFT